MYPLTAGIVIGNQELWNELQISLKELPVRIVLEASQIGDIGAFVEKIDRMRPDLVFVDISDLSDPLDRVIRGIRGSSAAPAVFALNTTADAEMILNAMRAGATEYLYPPFGDAFHAALERIANERRAATQSHRRGGRTLGFVSAKGGCGATTIACHTAAELPGQTRTRVLLADLDFDAGLISFLLKSKSSYNISDAARNTHRLDENYWRALISNGIAGLEVITAPGPSSRTAIQPEQLRFVLSFVRTLYDWIVLDLGRSLNLRSLGALEEIDDLFLVTTLEVPALHQTKVIVQKLLDSGYRRERLHLLLNRAPKRFEVTREELEGMLGVPIYTTIPNDFNALNESYSEGKLLSPASQLGRRFGDLAARIAGVDQKAKKKFSFFG